MSLEAAEGALTISWGVLQIQDRSPQLRPVASECVCDWLQDTTSLGCGDCSWICNTPLRSQISVAVRFNQLPTVATCTTFTEFTEFTEFTDASMPSQTILA